MMRYFLPVRLKTGMVLITESGIEIKDAGISGEKMQ
jgi:hypothetical protein